MSNLSIKATNDGSSTIYNEELDEHYHSIHGALQESLHVFIEMGLNYHVKHNENLQKLNILEIGFGTGLNCILTLIEYLKNEKIAVKYSAIEPFPLNSTSLKSLNFKLSNQHLNLFNKIHESNWEKENIILYSNSNYRSQNDEVGLLWNDKKLNINWPKVKLIISKKDKSNMTFSEYWKKFKNR